MSEKNTTTTSIAISLTSGNCAPPNSHLISKYSSRKMTTIERLSKEDTTCVLSRELEKATDEFVSTHKVKPNMTKQEQKGLKSEKERKDVVVF